MIKISTELKTGLFAVIAIILFIWGFDFIKNEKLFSNSRHFFAVYNNVQGLEASSIVTVNGLKVGKVDKIIFHPSKKGKLIVRFSLNNNFKFSKSSIAKIYSTDLIGRKSLAIIPSFKTDLAVSGDTLKSEIEPGMFELLNDKIAPLQSKIESLVTNSDSVMQNINQVLDSTTIAKIKASILNLDVTLKQFRSASKNINEILNQQKENISKIATNSANITTNLNKLTDTLVKADLGKSIRNLQSVTQKFDTILTNLNRGKGSVGKLLQDETLYNNMSNASKQLEELLKDMKLHPKRFVHFSIFGKKSKPYKKEKPSN